MKFVRSLYCLPISIPVYWSWYWVEASEREGCSDHGWQGATRV